MPLSGLTTAFLILSALFAALTAARMARVELHARYRCLFAYLVFLVPYSAYPLLLDIRSSTYYHVWLASEPLNWVFQILVVRELCGLVLAPYKGLLTLGRWGMYCGIAISGAISLATLLPHIKTTMTHRSHILYYMEAGDRGMNLALAIFLLVMMALVSRYPVTLSRNVIVNAVTYTILFFCNTLGALLHTIFDLRVSSSVDAMLSGAGAFALVIWFFLLTPKGEQTPAQIAHLDAANEERALNYLDELNKMVLNLGRT